MLNNKVSKIEFHITYNQLEDFILRAAELIKDNYEIEQIKVDPISIGYLTEPEPPYHITFVKRGQNKWLPLQ